MKVGICAGHCMQAPGASNDDCNVNEQWVCRLVSQIAAFTLTSRGHTAISPDSDVIFYKPTIGKSGRVYGPADLTLFHRAGLYRQENVDLILDVHMDVRDTEQFAMCIHHDDSENGERASTLIADELARRVHRHRGYSPAGKVFAQSELGRNLYILRATKAPAVVVEICKLNHDQMAFEIINNVEAFAMEAGVAIAEGVEAYAK